MQDIIDKAGVLVESLPYIREFNDKIFVIKFGGSIMEDKAVQTSLMRDVTLLKYVGVNPVIVHGGGSGISKVMESLDLKAEFVDGLRVTDGKTMEVAEMVLTGKVNKEIVSLINNFGGSAVGISGKDGGLVRAEKLRKEGPDLGYVGQVKNINPELIFNLIDNGYIPVVSPVAADKKGESYNINADTVAGRLAGATDAEKLIFLTNVPGISHNPEDKNDIISRLSISEVYDWLEEGKIEGGMIPKVQACIRALEAGVVRTHILNGLTRHSLLLEIYTKQGIGTMIYND